MAERGEFQELEMRIASLEARTQRIAERQREVDLMKQEVHILYTHQSERLQELITVVEAIMNELSARNAGAGASASS